MTVNSGEPNPTQNNDNVDISEIRIPKKKARLSILNKVLKSAFKKEKLATLYESKLALFFVIGLEFPFLR